MRYGPAHVRMPEHSIISLKNTSYGITAEIETPEAPAGCWPARGNMAGWALYIDEEHRPSFVYNWFGHEFTTLKGSPLGAGEQVLEVHYAHDGGFAAGGRRPSPSTGRRSRQSASPARWGLSSP